MSRGRNTVIPALCCRCGKKPGVESWRIVLQSKENFILVKRISTATNPTLGTIVQWFKTMTTNAYIRGVKEQNWEPFLGKLWQRNYYEKIIRNDRQLTAVREYIHNNPTNWREDELNPDDIDNP